MRMRWFLLLSVALLAGCATGSDGPGRPYSQHEYGQMSFCVGMSDSAVHVATKKLQGAPARELRDYYASRPYAKLNLATVDKVYAASLSRAETKLDAWNTCMVRITADP